MKTIRNIDVKNKTVLVRVDYNVPIFDGEVESDLRIRASLPTLKYLRENGAKNIILISHLGRPDGQISKNLSLAPVAETLKTFIPDVHFINDVSGPDVNLAVKNLKPGGILLLENLRFHKGEEENSEDFIREIVDSVGAEIFVQDGFAVVHRAHASTAAIAKCLPVYAGFLLEKEIENLDKVTKSPTHPLTVIIGGAKVEDKQPLIDRFLNLADNILVGGKIAADGYKSTDKKIYIAEDFDEDEEGNRLDCGPISTSKFAEIVSNSKTIIWNGLLGKAEDSAYSTSTTIVAKLIGENPDIFSVICGGDTAGFIEELESEYSNLKYNLVSTGGGASLEYLCGNTLPGLEVIKN